MIQRYNATIVFDTKDNHPDEKGAKGLIFKDVYNIDTDIFSGDIQGYIKRDLALVAGGGYDTDTITNVHFNIEPN